MISFDHVAGGGIDDRQMRGQSHDARRFEWIWVELDVMILDLIVGRGWLIVASECLVQQHESSVS